MRQTNTIVCTKAMCLDESLVPRASEYLPERWLPGREHLKPKHAFVNIPFGFGPRMCAGKRFADLEMEVLCARVSGRVRVGLPVPTAACASPP